jgi:rhamnose transport system ATP-binding protein
MPLLEAAGITKSFAGVHALKGVSFELRAGEVHALVGENGAGKSTLIQVIAGALTPDAGTLMLDGVAVVHNSPALARSLGIAVVYQQPALFPDLTVAENIALALESGGAWRRVNWKSRTRRASELLASAGAEIHPERLARSLSMPEQQMVEIAKAIGVEAKVLILDEPTASLTSREVESLFRVIAGLRSGGAGIIYISHRLEEVASVGDRVTVLRDGEAVATRSMQDVDRAELIRLMVGREVSAIFPKREVPLGPVALEARGVSSQAAGLRGVSLTVRSGEILGIAGLVGSGRTELAETLCGLRLADSGEVTVNGKIGYVPEDRRRHGVVLEMPVAANISVASLESVTRRGMIVAARERELAQGYVDRLRVKTESIQAPVESLSGGNQQKVALARWLAVKPAVLILDEPTQGVDVGSKAEIHALMVDLAAQGMAIVMISSEMPEILGMSDRIAVMQAGTIAGVLSRAEATQQAILALALGSGSVQ